MEMDSNSTDDDIINYLKQVEDSDYFDFFKVLFLQEEIGEGLWGLTIYAVAQRLRENDLEPDGLLLGLILTPV